MSQKLWVNVFCPSGNHLYHNILYNERSSKWWGQFSLLIQSENLIWVFIKEGFIFCSAFCALQTTKFILFEFSFTEAILVSRSSINWLEFVIVSLWLLSVLIEYSISYDLINFILVSFEAVILFYRGSDSKVIIKFHCSHDQVIQKLQHLYTILIQDFIMPWSAGFIACMSKLSNLCFQN